jgi:hypothetical protein
MVNKRLSLTEHKVKWNLKVGGYRPLLKPELLLVMVHVDCGA